MKNPYEILGVKSGASLDEIKKAYREKARMYNDDFARMEELNDAYDYIISNQGSRNNDSAYSNTSYTGNTSTSSDFSDIRAKMNNGRIDDAEVLLDGIPSQNRTAEWYFLKGKIQHRRGWLESALENFERAKNLEPDNAEYQSAYNELNKSKKGSFKSKSTTEKEGCCDCGACDICSALMCADCCCECFGGDLIRCC